MFLFNIIYKILTIFTTHIGTGSFISTVVMVFLGFSFLTNASGYRVRSFFVSKSVFGFIGNSFHEHSRLSTRGGQCSKFASSSSADLDYGTCGQVIPVPILNDNYAYLLVDPTSQKCACVDPAEPEKLLEAAQSRGLKLDTLLCTHHHWDHAGGNEKMAKMVPGIEVVSSSYESIPEVTTALKDGDEFLFGNLKVKALYTPCHTKGHILFYITPANDQASGDPILFSGDTLFVGGCGRFFEGDASQMTRALMEVAAKLPKETKVFCGHEYTLGNLAFAESVEPNNTELLNKLQWAKSQLEQGKYTIPSTIGEELTYNPFMRVDQPSVKSATGAQDPERVMHLLREMKNNF
mmetsp:Transcript_29119/g.36546  ORF Transcript_29119/g.36546 Transcript_29119/m.36546 type:complete len:350 (+) Transcript_29119:59-1108(+)